MSREEEYSAQMGSAHLKKFGQFFTPEKAAEFMVKWACRGAQTMLDPAAGNSMFLRTARKLYPDCTLTGCELDPAMLEHFGNPAGAEIIQQDYLKTDWDTHYDAIVCNPPYHRFQAVPERDAILSRLEQHTGIRYSRYTNLCVLFLIKSIEQMGENGRLAYLMPSEFLNSDYGTQVKQLLLDRKLLRAVVHFEHDETLYPNALTTSCILLLDKTRSEQVEFYRVDDLEELGEIEIGSGTNCRNIPIQELDAERKWRFCLRGEEQAQYRNLKPLSEFGTVTRGIATGANEFFCFSEQKIQETHISRDNFLPCICRSADVKTPVFQPDDFRGLNRLNRNILLLNVRNPEEPGLNRYIQAGEREKLHRRYITARRSPWYSMEQKDSAPIWISSACRNSVRVVRNLAGVRNLTTVHSFHIKEPYQDDTDLIFCVLLTRTAQEILRQNRKLLGGGLEKFQPNDLNQAQMPDITVLTEQDRAGILAVYESMTAKFEPEQLDELDRIVSPYVRL